jgi:pimeloyl-ACP methyl ester carboxylesterase
LVLCHGYGASLAATAPFARRLAAKGFTTLGFDFRAHGRSGGRVTTIGLREVDDALGAVDWLVRRFPDAPLGIYGVSMGGSVALQAAALDQRIRAVASDCAFASLDQMVEWRKRSLPGAARPLLQLSFRTAEWLTGARATHFRPVDHVERIAPRSVLLMHAEFDKTVPLEHFRQLSERLPPAAERWLIKGCGHIAGSTAHAQTYLERVATFFHRALVANAASDRSTCSPVQESDQALPQF